MRELIFIFFFIIIFSFNLSAYQIPDRYKGDMVELREELSIGVYDGPEEYMFNRLIHVDADSKGNIYVADVGNVEIKVYDANGKYLRLIGRRGKGPGEFRYPSYFFIDTNDLLYVLDGLQNRLTVFNSEGSFIKTFPLADRDKTFGIFYVDESGNFIVQESPKTYDETGKKDIREINIYSNNLVFIKNIFSRNENTHFYIQYGERGTMTRLQPFYYMVLCEYIPQNKVVYGFTEMNKLYIYDNKNNSVIQKKFDYNPIKVTSKDKKEYAERHIGKEWSRNMKNEVNRKVFFPKNKPPFRRIFVDDTGYIILVTYKEDKEKGTECMLFDLEGNFLKNIYFKAVPDVLQFKNGKIYSIVKTEDEWYKVVRY